jgi:hypothetical protein
MPAAKPSAKKRAVNFRLPIDLLSLLEDEAIADGRGREEGRVYSPSATLERILRQYFAGKPAKKARK